MNHWPFHPDELDAQARAGLAAPGAGIRDFMPDQHRSFFALLRYLFIATADASGWPLATIATGPAGFVHSPDPRTLRVDFLPAPPDPVAAAFSRGQDIGIIGIDFSNRRRNRANGKISDVDTDGFTVTVRQSFGNCSKYIQRRSLCQVPETHGEIIQLSSLDVGVRVLAGRSDTLFVASRSRAEFDTNGGIDISHRGGRPGFVHVSGDSLIIPDFSGNNYFNTLGNFLGEPRASLLFIDFETGEIVQLQGIVTIDWSHEAAKRIDGAERLWRFEVVRGWRCPSATSLRWSFVDYSPATLGTGTGDRSLSENA